MFLLEDPKKSLPIIPGISTAPGTMVYAGSIGTQIANELLDFNRCGDKACFLFLTRINIYLHMCLKDVLGFNQCILKLSFVSAALG